MGTLTLVSCRSRACTARPALALRRLRAAAELGRRTDGNNDSRGGACGDGGTCVEHASPVGYVRGRGGVGGLGDQLRLTGKARLVDFQAAGLKNPAVGRHSVTGLHGYHGSGDQLIGRRQRLGAAPAEPDPYGRLVDEPAQRVAGPRALDATNESVDAHHCADKRGIDDRPADGRQAGPAASAGVNGFASSWSEARTKPGSSCSGPAGRRARLRSASSAASPAMCWPAARARCRR